MQFSKKELEILETGKLTLLEYLAVDRNKMANQRLLLTYLRVGLYFIVFGLTAYKLEELKELISVVYIFFSFGILSILIGVIQYYRINKVLNKYLK